jgi:hypothetical protein
MTEEPASTPAARPRRAGAAARNAKDAVANAVAFHRADGLHVAKTTLAAVLAWVVAHCLTMAGSAVWMGPATAVIVVQATVYRASRRTGVAGRPGRPAERRGRRDPRPHDRPRTGREALDETDRIPARRRS